LCERTKNKRRRDRRDSKLVLNAAQHAAEGDIGKARAAGSSQT
jgi:hypothetical protein